MELTPLSIQSILRLTNLRILKLACGLNDPEDILFLSDAFSGLLSVSLSISSVKIPANITQQVISSFSKDKCEAMSLAGFDIDVECMDSIAQLSKLFSIEISNRNNSTPMDNAWIAPVSKMKRLERFILRSFVVDDKIHAFTTDGFIKAFKDSVCFIYLELEIPGFSFDVKAFRAAFSHFVDVALK